MSVATHSNPRLASDPRLPQRDVLLDARAVAARLSAALGVKGRLEISECERVRTKYRVGDSLRVLHRIRVGGESYTVAARAFAAGKSLGAFERAARTAVDCAPLRAVLHDAELETVFWTFPNDRRLGDLRAIRDVPAELARLFTPRWERSRLVAYAPEKCATVQCLDARSHVIAYAKIYAGDEARQVYNVYRALAQCLATAGSADIAIARALAYDERHHMLLLAPAAGARIADLSHDDLPLGYKRLGAALAALHNLPAPDGLPRFKRLDAERLRQAALAIGAARPDVQREAYDLADKLEHCAPRDAEPHVCLHGDVHAKNGILRGEQLTLIDFDQCGTGQAAADIGSLLASLTYNRLTADATAAGALSADDTLAAAFLSGYSSVRELPAPESLRWHTAAALLAERALRAVNRIRPEGLARLRELLNEAKEILRKGDLR